MKSKRQKIAQICLGLFVAIAIYLLFINAPLPVQADLNLKSDIIALQSRINRLEQEVRSLSRTNSRSLNRTAKVEQPSTGSSSNHVFNNPEVDGQIIGRSDPLYERFATLLIELKEDVKNLDRRLTEIEAERPAKETSRKN